MRCNYFENFTIIVYELQYLSPVSKFFVVFQELEFENEYFYVTNQKFTFHKVYRNIFYLQNKFIETS
jgi:hypothetical protein